MKNTAHWQALLNRYFEGDTSISDEKALKAYFSQPNIDPSLIQYKIYFIGVMNSAAEQAPQSFSPPQTKVIQWKVFMAAASVALLIGIGFYQFSNNPLQENAVSSMGNCETPEEAYAQTCKALAMVSKNINKGVESVEYIQEYKNAQDKIYQNN
ncbi:MAG: hypothetical protein CFE24_00340 [Flavobacterium sp. BFFFF2]|nr:MAG: hypothetical protein CFE24_00340 [Flavobacterium sp. BFFFF2]